MIKTSTLLVSALITTAFASYGMTLEQAIASKSRTTANTERDQYRHPLQTLDFFEVEPSHTVVEVWPGRGWYTEILAPYLKDGGQYYAAHFPANSEVAFFKNMRATFNERITAQPEFYECAILTDFSPPEFTDIAPETTADRILTFRNVHNWMRNDSEQSAFNAFFKALKPGGILGVVEHRAKPNTPREVMVKSGYVTEEYVKQLATKAGFKWTASSDINANHKDSTDHPKGVWTLPPTLRLGAEKKDYYTIIGESDRMTLKFIKPNI